MKNLDKIITNILILTWVGLSCSILRAEVVYDVVITEIFIKQADGTHTPQYIELYNKSDSPINKVLIFVFFTISKSSSFVLIPLSEINGPL